MDTDFSAMTDDALNLWIISSLSGYDVTHEYLADHGIVLTNWTGSVDITLALPLPNKFDRWHLEELTDGVWHGAVFGSGYHAYCNRAARALAEAWAITREASNGTPN